MTNGDKNITVRRSKRVGEEIHSATLGNGLRVFLVPRRGMRKKTALFATKYGSIDLEFQPTPGTTRASPPGVAHFLEHQLFKKEGVDLSMEFGKYGASSNAFTSHDTTAYYFSGTRHFEENLALLAAIVFAPYFDQTYVDKERLIIEQEIRMSNDIPDNRCSTNLLQALYRLHPVRLDIAGTAESIGAITPATLAECHRTFYAPGNMVLVISGDLEPRQTFATVERLCGSTNGNGHPIKRFTPVEPRDVACPTIEATMRVSRPRVMVGFKENDIVADDGEAVRRELMIDAALELCLGKGSRWHEKAYASGAIDDSFSASATREVSFGFTAIGGETDDVDRFLAAIDDGFRRGIRDEIDRRGIERLRRAKLGRYVRIFDAPDDIVFACADWMMSGIDIFDYPAMLRTLRKDDLVERIERLIDGKHRAVSIIRPMEGTGA